MMQQVNKLFQQGGMGHVKEWKGVQYSHHGYMHPRNAGGKRNSQPSTEGDLPEEGSCNEIGQGTLSARSRRGERTSRSTLVPKNNGVFEPNNDPNQKDSILKSGQEVTNEGEHDIYGRYMRWVGTAASCFTVPTGLVMRTTHMEQSGKASQTIRTILFC